MTTEGGAGFGVEAKDGFALELFNRVLELFVTFDEANAAFVFTHGAGIDLLFGHTRPTFVRRFLWVGLDRTVCHDSVSREGGGACR